MSNKNKKLGLGIAAVAAAGAGLVYAAQKTSQQKAKKIAKAAPPIDYRNTERGKYEKNSKGIYYTNGNYEAFARPKKPEGVDDKNAYIVGSGLAALAAACFLVRDGQMPGSHIHILEEFLIRHAVMSCAAAVRWKIILNVCGICSAASLRWKWRVHPCWMNITG